MATVNSAAASHLFSFAGERAATANHTHLAQAKERAARGDDAEAIRVETGWHIGVDGKWRFEIDDHAAGFNTTLLSNLRGGGFGDRQIEAMSYRRDDDSTYQLCLAPVAPEKVSDFVTIRAIPEAMVKELISTAAWQAIERGDGEEDFIGANLDDAKRVQVAFKFAGFNALPLDAVMEHPALFAAYPALRRVMVAVDPKLANGAALQILDYADGTDGMVIKIGNPALSNVERAILHEIQHAVQNLEGFAPGGAPNQFKTVHSDEVAAILKRELRAAQRAKGYLSWFESMPDVPSAAQQKAIDKVQAARRAVKQFDDTGEDPRVLSATQQYFQLAGEVEARNVEHRRALNAEERQKTPPEATEDVPRAKQSVTSNDTSLMLSFAGEQAQTADLPSLAAAQARIEAGQAARAQIRNLDKVAVEEVDDGGALKFRATQAGAYLGRFGTAEEAQAFIADERGRMRTLLEQINKDSAETVRQDTGWHQADDGRWRFEINDADARFAEQIYFAERGKWYPARFIADARSHDNQDGATGTLGAVLHHPALFAAYPSLGDMPITAKIRRGPESGIFDGASVFAQAETPEQLLSVILHEIQHGIQQIEQFASGGDLIGNRPAYTEKLKEDLAQLLAADPALSRAYGTWKSNQREMVQALASAVEFDDAATQRSEDALRALPKGQQAWDLYFSIKKMKSDWSADEVMSDRYWRLAGEVEARNTQARQSLSAQERQQTSPEATADVPRAERIVSMGDGARIDQTKTAAFKAWFGDWEDPLVHSSKRSLALAPVSTSMNADGTPQVFYHGTRGDFNAFETGRDSHNSDAFLGSWDVRRHGIFFAEAPAHAEAFTTDNGDDGVQAGANVMPVYLRTLAPLDLTSGVPEGVAEELAATGEVSTRWAYNHLGDWSNFDDETGEAFVRALRAAGYDSVVFNDTNPDTGETVTSTVVLDPEQIKSAIGNRGTFDPQSPNISHLQPKSADDTTPGAQTLTEEQAAEEIANDDALFETIADYTADEPDVFERKPEMAKRLRDILSRVKPSEPWFKTYYRGAPSNSPKTDRKRGFASWSANERTAKEFAKEYRDGVVSKREGKSSALAVSTIFTARMRLRDGESHYTGDQAEYFVLDANDSTAPDSGGAAFSRTSDDQTQTEEFKEWFGESKVVTALGQPLMVYHGTASDFTVFQGGRGGFYFTDDYQAAKVYAAQADGDEPRTIGAYLSMSNPMVLDKAWYDENVMAGGEPAWEGVDNAIYEAEEKGHDGLILRGFPDFAGIENGVRMERAYDQYVAFRPEQIKSATDNNGQFDGSKPDIRFSLAVAEEPPPAEETPMRQRSRG